jgi:hypothetical protein
LTSSSTYVLFLFMFDREAMAQEQDAVLQELTELGLEFARELKAQVKLVRSVEDAQALARAYDRVVRSVRLALALRTRLARDNHELARLDRASAQKAADSRKAQIKAVLEPEIYTEDADQTAADTLYERLTERLDRDALFETFLNAPIGAAIARIRKDLGLLEAPEAPVTSPIAAAMAGGDEERGFAEGKADAIDDDLSIGVTNVRADARAGPAERSKEPGVERASQARCRTLAPSTTPSAGRGPPPAAEAGEVRKKPAPS